MTTIVDPLASASLRPRNERVILLMPTLLEEDDSFGTSDHVGFAVQCLVDPDEGMTTWLDAAQARVKAVSAEVKELRDRVSSLIGLTRQEIARAIGVDRRSLSGFVTGEIRPTEDRIAALRVLAETAAWSARQFGDRAREVLRGQDPEASPLKLIAEGRVDIRRELKAAAEQAGLGITTPVTVQERQTKEPLYIRASAEWTDKGHLPTREGVPRDSAQYEQDLSNAASGVPQATRPRRRKI